jgi:hypothetical protein
MMQHAYQASRRERATREANDKDFGILFVVVGQPLVGGSNVPGETYSKRAIYDATNPAFISANADVVVPELLDTIVAVVTQRVEKANDIGWNRHPLKLVAIRVPGAVTANEESLHVCGF